MCLGHPGRNKPYIQARDDVTNIFEWLQCLGTCIAIVGYTEPHRVPDLLGYQNLIIQGYHKYQKGCWQTYNCDFCQKITVSHIAE